MQIQPPSEEPGGEHSPGGAVPPWGSSARQDAVAESGEDAKRRAVRKTLEKKRGWTSTLVAYVVVNAFLVGIWAVTGRGYFWPGWVIGGWGIGMVMSFWDIFIRRPVSDADIDAELRRGGPTA